MRPWYSIGANFLAVLVFGALGMVLCAGLLPPLEQGRNEARSLQAYSQARSLSKSVTPTAATVALTERDPFGHPFRASRLSDGSVRVTSAGPNGTTPDADDITSDMPESPNRPYQRKHNRQLLIALGSGALCWVVSSLAWFRLKPTEEDKQFHENG